MLRSAVVVLVAMTAGCARHAPVTTAPARPRAALEFLAADIVPRPGRADPLYSARFGGISGIAFDPATGELLGISDDDADSRVFIFTVSGPGQPFHVSLKAYFPLPPGPGAAARLDPEAIAITSTGRLFIASEGFGDREPRVPPGIVEYSRHVAYVGQLAIPPRFLPPSNGPLTRGVRHNTGFESLTLTPDGQRLFTGTESALVQDGEPADASHGALARILEFVDEAGTFTARREFAYPVDPLAPGRFTPGFSVAGLVELLALDDTTLLAMERSYVEEAGGTGKNRTRIRIFLVSLADATDVAGTESLAGSRGVRPAAKTLLVDFDDVRGLPPELAALDNFEGLAFGPPLADGTRTLLVVSDDNFSDRQRTAFLLFRVNGPRVPPAGIE
jgi:3-phytase